MACIGGEFPFGADLFFDQSVDQSVDQSFEQSVTSCAATMRVINNATKKGARLEGGSHRFGLARHALGVVRTVGLILTEPGRPRRHPVGAHGGHANRLGSTPSRA